MKVSVVSLLVLGTAACGPGLAGHDPTAIAWQEAKQRARQAFVQRLQDPASVQAMLRESVVNGGLWFDDPACAASFPIGEIEPETKFEIMQSKVTRITGTLRFCIDESGVVDSVVPLRVTGFPAYDRKILAGVRAWRFTPPVVDGKPITMCSAVTFIYSQK